MELFNVNAKIEKLHSEKKGTDYIAITIPLSSTYSMTYFPKDAEKEIIKNSDLNKSSVDSNINNTIHTSDSVSPFDFGA